MPQRPAPSRPFVRLVLAISLDGRLAPPVGGAAQLGGEGDRRALEHALAWGDACLIGAGTLRAHQCTCLIRSPQLLEQRRSEGRTEQPAAVVVSRSLTSQAPGGFLISRCNVGCWLLNLWIKVLIGGSLWLQPGRSVSRRLERLGFSVWCFWVAPSSAPICCKPIASMPSSSPWVPQLLGGRFSWLPCTNAPLPAALAQPGAWQSEGAEDLGDGEWLVRYRRIRSG